MQRMQQYIASHLSEDITPSDLSRVSLFSPWYSYRLFIQWTHLSPSDYIRRLRLSKSALMLRDERCKVADIAFAMGFGSVDGYQRAFFREFGCNPRAYAQRPIPISLFIPYGVKYNQTRKEAMMEPVKTVFIRMMEKPARKAMIKRGVSAEDYFAFCEEVGCDVWGLLTSIPSISGEPVCFWLPEAYRPHGTSKYVQGVEVALDADITIPEGFDVIELPAATYLSFQGEPFAEEDYCRAIDEVWHAIDRYNPAVMGYAWDPENPRIQLEPIGTRGYIELMPVRAL